MNEQNDDRRPMASWRLAYDQAHAQDDFATLDILNAAWETAVDELEAEGLDSNDDDLVAAQTFKVMQR